MASVCGISYLYARVLFKGQQEPDSDSVSHVAVCPARGTFPPPRIDGECRLGTGCPRPARPGGPPDSSRSLDEAVATRQPGAEDIRPLFLYFGDMNVNGTAQGRVEPVGFLSACDLFSF